MDKTLSITHGDSQIEVSVEERVYSDRSAGQYESGWHVYDWNTDTEYFVSDSGDVWLQPDNEVVGICAELQEQAERMEKLMDEAIMELP